MNSHWKSAIFFSICILIVVGCTPTSNNTETEITNKSMNPDGKSEQALFDLAKLLAPTDSELLKELELSVSDPQQYIDIYMEQRPYLFGDMAPYPSLPWDALLLGFKDRDRLVYVDWKAEPEDVTWNLDRILPDHIKQDSDRWSWVEWTTWEETSTENFLTAIGKWLHQQGYSLVHLGDGSDSYPLMVIDRKLIPQIASLAEQVGYDKIQDMGAIPDKPDN